MLWSGWGDPAEATTLSPGVLSAEQAAALQAVAALDTSDDARLRHLRGKSTPDLLRIRAGDVSAAPDGVLTPQTHDQIQRLLEICSEERIAVVPFGGGTSVVGGLTPHTDLPTVAL